MIDIIFWLSLFLLMNINFIYDIFNNRKRDSDPERIEEEKLRMAQLEFERDCAGKGKRLK